jgi:hypothetical protein
MARITADGEAAWNATASTQDAGLRFYTTSQGTTAERVRIDAYGNVGIGTNTIADIAGGTSRTLEIYGGASGGGSFLHITNSTTGQTTFDGLVIGVSGGASDVLFIQREAANIIFRTDNTERVRIDATGNVGIGTTNPKNKLTVLGSIAKQTTTGYDGVFDNIFKYGVQSDLEGSGQNLDRWIGADATVTAGGGDANKLKFRVYSGGGSGSPADVMTLLGNGNVGIGTASPAAKLDVVGTQKLQNSVVVNSSTQSILTSSSDGIAGLCWIRNADVGGQALVLWDASFGLTIVSQLGSIFTTSSPSATQIQLSVGGSNPYYIQAIAGSSRNGNTLRTSAINNH